MTRVIITIDTDNAAFEDFPDDEMAKCLAQVRIEAGQKIFDTNGNTVGGVEVHD